MNRPDHQPLDLDTIEECIRAIRKTLNPHKSLHDQGAWNTLAAIEKVIDPHEENIPRERQERAVKPEDLINQRAEARTSTGHIHARGRIIAYTDRPTYLIETDTGERISWIADMNHPEPPRHDCGKTLTECLQRIERTRPGSDNQPTTTDFQNGLHAAYDQLRSALAGHGITISDQEDEQ